MKKALAITTTFDFMNLSPVLRDPRGEFSVGNEPKSLLCSEYRFLCPEYRWPAPYTSFRCLEYR